MSTPRKVRAIAGHHPKCIANPDGRCICVTIAKKGQART